MINTPEENDLLEALTKTAKGRMQIIEELSVDHPENWQTVSTPYDIVREMCDLLPSDVSHYCILFSLEFLEVLIKERDACPSNIIFFGDNQLETDVAAHEMMYGVRTGVISKHEIAGNGFDCSVLDGLLQEGKKSLLGDDMKFSKLAVLMNPPYQISDGGHKRSAKPIYHLFITTIIDHFSPDYLVSINPSRWMIGGKGLDPFRKKMISDRRIKVIVDDMSCSGIFHSVVIQGGVNYFIWDKSHDGKCLFNGVERLLDEEDIVIRENESRSILEKVKKISSKWIGSSVSPRKPYGLDGEAEEVENGVPCWHKQSIGLRIVSPNVVKDARNDLQKWRVLVPYAISGRAEFSVPHSIFSKKSTLLAKPGEYCTETYIVLKSFSKEIEAKNFISYFRTRFFRFMLRMRTVSQHVTRNNYNWVPDVEDYSTAWTDKELYDKYNLSRQERQYVESKIKELK